MVRGLPEMIPLIDTALEQYAAAHSEPPSSVRQELERYTRDHCRNAEMVVGDLEGALLQMLVELLAARRVLEIGLFTGYSALSMAEVLPPDGEVVSCEIDPDHARIAQSFFDRSPHGHKVRIALGPALASLADIEGPFDLVFLDADKENYLAYYQAALPLLRRGGVLAADNVLWSGRVLKPQQDTDRALVAFNDALRADARVSTVLLTVRDGVLLARKR